MNQGNADRHSNDGPYSDDRGGLTVVKKKRYRLGIKRKVAAVFVVMGIMLLLGIGYGTYTLNYRQAATHYTELALSSAQMAASLINGDSIDGYLQNGEDAEYQRTYENLQKLKSSYDLTYLYVLKPVSSENDSRYVFDIYTDGNDSELISGLGDWYNDDELYAVVREVYQTGHSTGEVIVTNDKYGYLASAYTPVLTTDGSVAAVVGADINMDVILGEVRTRTFQIFFFVAAIITIFLIILMLIINKQILKPIVSLSQHMGNFTGGDGAFQEFTVSATGDELQTMSESFNRMVGDIKLYIKNLSDVTADRERIATELGIAAQIQSDMLPSIFPAFPERDEFDIYATMQPAKEVGGDFYDFFLIDDDHLGIVMADVSGKSVPAALFMVIAKTLINNRARDKEEPQDVFTNVNSQLCESNETSMFVTAWFGVLEISSGKMTYVNAGHNPPLLKKAGGLYEYLKTNRSLMLAGMSGYQYKQFEMQLEKGDMLFLYTDGVTEANNTEDELYGEERLLSILNNCSKFPPTELLPRVKADIDLFADGAPQFDDITMLLIQMNQSLE